MKQTVQTLQAMKERGEKIAMLTCYDYTMAKLMDAAGTDMLLVGDSLGNVILGYSDTISVTMEDMIHHSACVVRACENTMVIMDMPFMSYQASVSEAVRNAGRLMKEARGHAVKLEGGAAVAEQIRAITDSGIPVQAHIGMTPQSVNVFGGFKVQGKGEDAAKRLLEDAFTVQEAGAFSVVLEITRIGLQILTRAELGRIEEHGRYRAVALLHRRFDQTGVSFMQIAHGRHQTDGQTLLFPLAHLCAYFCDGCCDFHCICSCFS